MKMPKRLRLVLIHFSKQLIRQEQNQDNLKRYFKLLLHFSVKGRHNFTTITLPSAMPLILTKGLDFNITACPKSDVNGHTAYLPPGA